MLPNFRNMAMNMIRQNPNVVNNPNAQEIANVIESGDSVKGKQIAQNICSTYGISLDQAVQSAKQFLNIR